MGDSLGINKSFEFSDRRRQACAAYLNGLIEGKDIDTSAPEPQPPRNRPPSARPEDVEAYQKQWQSFVEARKHKELAKLVKVLVRTGRLPLQKGALRD